MDVPTAAAAQETAVEEAVPQGEDGAETASQAACATEDTDGVFTILCYGDSNTYGFDPRDGARYLDELLWTTILNEKLGEGYQVINEGRNGRTTAYDVPGIEGKNGLDYFTNYLAENKDADLIVFMLGSNDFFIGELTPEDIRDGMESLIEAVEEVRAIVCGWSPKIAIIAPPLIDEDMMLMAHGDPCTAAAEKSRAIVPLYKQLAKDHDCLFVDASQALDVSELDGLHLSEEGHRQMAELLYQFITEEFPEQ